MWQISATRWLNPLAIAWVRDNPPLDRIAVGTIDGQEGALEYSGAERQAVLAHLARTSTPVVPSDADLTGWPYDDDPTS